MNEFVNSEHDQQMQEFITPLAQAITDLDEVTQYLVKRGEININDLGVAANDYLHLFGYTAMAFIWAKMAETSLAGESRGDQFYRGKIKTARYYFQKLMPRRLTLIANIKVSSDTVFDIEDELF